MKLTKSSWVITIVSGCIFSGSSLAGGPKVDRWGNPISGNGPGFGLWYQIVQTHEGPETLSLISDAAGDQGSGPVYGDCRKAGVDNSGAKMTVAQKINGTFPATPPGDVAAYSWRFDTDLNPNTGYMEFPYIGIEWEILIQDGGGFWTVNKWSQSTGYLPCTSGRIKVKTLANGDMVFVTFNASEIGSPTSSNWIVWNGYYPTWADLAPDASVAFWTQ